MKNFVSDNAQTKELILFLLISVPLSRMHIGFMIQSVLDKGRILSWYHALENRNFCSGEKRNMFELVRNAKYDNAYSVSFQIIYDLLINFRDCSIEITVPFQTM